MCSPSQGMPVKSLSTFKFDEFIDSLNEANLLYKVVQKFTRINLSPAKVSNHDMGIVFEELIRRFAESSNETAGEHFTPRDIVQLTTSLGVCRTSPNEREILQSLGPRHERS